MSKAYQVVTDKILALIESGVCPWRMPWSQVTTGPQSNGITGRDYRGCNQFLTSVVAYSHGYTSGLWLSYKQAQECGGQVRKGEKGCPIVYAGEFIPESEESSDRPRRCFFLRYSTVFNACQIDGLAPEFYAPDVALPIAAHERLAACESIIGEYCEHGPKFDTRMSNRAFYRPADDTVTMPLIGQFATPEAYYATAFHELGHSTGHSDRLARKGIVEFDKFGSEQYGQEELVAELTSAFLCQRAGIDSATLDNSASYLDNWRKAIKADVKLIVVAAAQAQRAADMIAGVRETVDAE